MQHDKVRILLYWCAVDGNRNMVGCSGGVILVLVLNDLVDQNNMVMG